MIFPRFIQIGQEEVTLHLVNLTRSLALGYIPQNWRKAKATFIQN